MVDTSNQGILFSQWLNRGISADACTKKYKTETAAKRIVIISIRAAALVHSWPLELAPSEIVYLGGFDEQLQTGL
jgi:hypothetical protein